MPVHCFSPQYDPPLECKQTASHGGCSQSTTYSTSSALNTQSLSPPPPTLPPQGICTLLPRWVPKPTNKQPSDVYMWSTTLSKASGEGGESSFALAMRRIRNCRLWFVMIQTVFRIRGKYHRHWREGKYSSLKQSWGVNVPHCTFLGIFRKQNTAITIQQCTRQRTAQRQYI